MFENTANGPDGLDGSLVNNGAVSVPNPVQGSGQITNNGAFSLSPGMTFGATSYSQGARGTLSLGIIGGSTPAVPELQLSGAAELAGALAVSTTGPAARGTFPVIADATRGGAFSSTRFAGEGYSLKYASTGVSLNGPASTPGGAVLHVGRISGGPGRLTASLSCAGGSGSCPPASVKATITEHLRGRRITGVTASGRKQGKAKRITIATASATLRTGSTKTLTVALNATGRALLARFGQLRTAVTVSAGGRTLKSATVTVTKARRARKRSGVAPDV